MPAAMRVGGTSEARAESITLAASMKAAKAANRPPLTACRGLRRRKRIVGMGRFSHTRALGLSHILAHRAISNLRA